MVEPVAGREVSDPVGRLTLAKPAVLYAAGIPLHISALNVWGIRVSTLQVIRYLKLSIASILLCRKQVAIGNCHIELDPIHRLLAQTIKMAARSL